MHAHHDHHHCHSHRGGKNKRRLAFTLVLAAGYLVAEVVGGLMTNSLALLADAGHMLSDVAALALSFFAVWIADRPAPPHRTYGYYRAEILAALANGAALVAVSGFIIFEAFQRLWEPPEVQAPLMLWIAVGGLLINLAGLWMLHGGRDESLNVRGAWLHVLSDTLGSVGVILAAGLIWAFGWYWSDPVASLIIGLLVIYSSWRLLAEATAVLMESAPRGIDVDEVRDAVVAMDDVKGIHDLHIWTITSGLDSLSAHVVSDDGQSHPDLLTRLRTMLHDRFGIDHITIQIEPEGFVERETPI
ncbi:MAG: cation transporter [Planctomycetaceae bacterium]|jgi:cobalt-zinc-cadmium efflux system protein|nr:cation transporter [Planctomycetaceae bacterium]MBT6484437.1 cation transporter [Planctomycetaceae bacterium]MBT6494918.1 cation transporter [Planctomycetaceae bacterium]